MTPRITTELHNVLETNPGKKHVHFTADGHYHFRVFSVPGGKDNNLYTRLQEVPEKSDKGISTGKFIQVPIKNLKGAADERFLVAKTMTREEVLAIAPVDGTLLSIATGPSKAEILATLGVSDEELAAFLAKPKKK
jgi:hypothetical protein